MPGVVVIGAQWGDEGKGKITDVLAERANMVVRFQGGNNAGHTVVVGEDTFKFHLIPSGVIHGKKVRIAQGVVLDPRVMVKELDELEKRGHKADLKIDPRTHIILPYHNLLDAAREDAAKGKKIGTTLRGIGPCYEDKAARSGIRFEDLIDRDRFKKRVAPTLQEKLAILSTFYGTKDIPSADDIIKQYQRLGARLRPYLGDVSKEVHNTLHADDSIVLFEGAQGTLLDLAFGTYPYVTSSHPLSGSVFINVGLQPMPLEVIGVMKAYTTRVGKGPFPTELDNREGEHLRKQGKEFGTTTGRSRRCGWLDIPMLRYSARLNGFTQLALTKLDVLSGMKTLRIATEYKCKGKTIDEFPHDHSVLESCRPKYEKLEGFTMPEQVEGYLDLPQEARSYISFIQRHMGIPITMISIGPGRDQTLYMAKPV